ncbi:MAG: glycine cleavage system aminomethyltransferase GcvT [Ignavibacteriae bacterium]|nr:glycine cleavage system aminomethyltransferase GcvT [Ignavibacteriota bacterium]
MSLKRTAFYDTHVRLGAKIVEFGGFEMPVQYGGIIEEHRRVRESVGVFDVSHMGEIEVWGMDATDFIQKITVNDASKLVEGRVQYSAMCYENGGIVDDLLVYHMGDHYMLVVNASNTDKDLEWMRKNIAGDIKLKNRSDDISLLAVQGPKSLATLQKLTQSDLSSIQYYHFIRHKLAGVDMIISRTGYTGELGFELYFPSDVRTGEKVWDSVVKAGEEFGIEPVGLGARDTLRLEMGFCLYGNDIDHSTHPLEAGLGWITKLDKGGFLGSDVLLKAKKEGLRRKLVGFTLLDKAFPRHGYPINSNSSSIGTVTSGTFSPSLGKGIGMGYVDVHHAKPGTGIQVMIRNRELPATVVSVPFIKK